MLSWLFDYKIDDDGVEFVVLFGLFTVYRLPRERIMEARVVTPLDMLPTRSNLTLRGFGLANRVRIRHLHIRTVGNWQIDLTPEDPDEAVLRLNIS